MTTTTTNRSPCCCSFALLWCALLLVVSVAQASLVVTVGNNDESCVVIRVPSSAPSVVQGNFDVLDDDLSPKPVSVVLLDHDMHQLYKSPRGVSEDLFEIKIDTVQDDGGSDKRRKNRSSKRRQSSSSSPSSSSSRRLTLCVRNGVQFKSRDQLDRSVGLDVRVRTMDDDDTTTVDNMEDQLHQESTLLSTLTESITNKLYDLQNHHDYMRIREASHRQVTEQTYSQIVLWTVMEALVLVVVCVAQVLYLRKFFESKRYI